MGSGIILFLAFNKYISFILLAAVIILGNFDNHINLFRYVLLIFKEFIHLLKILLGLQLNSYKDVKTFTVGSKFYRLVKI